MNEQAKVEVKVDEDRTTRVFVNGEKVFEMKTPGYLSIQCEPHILQKITWVNDTFKDIDDPEEVLP